MMTPKGDLLMILDEESWMNVRRFRALHERGTPLAEIARECRCDWRTVKKYLAQDAGWSARRRHPRGLAPSPA
ncbi:hypothetical protein [Nostocoides sp.]|uniref:hypothetical protein n=1 Tax=Nostocoides sp. TaxID=1917966 RepID=UPI003BAF83EE